MVEKRVRKPMKKHDGLEKSLNGGVFQPSRFNPIFVQDNDEPPNHPNQSGSLTEIPVQQFQSSMPNPKVRSKSKGKSKKTPKVSKPILLRKPMPTTLSDFPILTRNHYKPSTSRATVPLDHRKHSSIVINENADPNILQTSYDPSPSCMEEQNLPTGDPPDQSCMQKDAMNGSTHPTESSLQQSPLHEPNEALGSDRAVAMLE
ncbi:hypothetical protein V6N13_091671 [Hibiscus sabdariffa]